MEQIRMFPNPVERLFGSLHGLIGIIQAIVLIIGVLFFLSSIMYILDMLKGQQQITIGELIGCFSISIIMIGIGGFNPNSILKRLDPNAQQTVAERKMEKEKELTGEEKLKKLNAYRKSNHKDVLLSDAFVTDQYLKYLKDRNLDENALK